MTSIDPDNPFREWQTPRTPESIEQSLLAMIGELSFNTAGLLQIVKMRHKLDQKDTTLFFEFASSFGADIATPSIFKGKPIQKVIVNFGETMVQSDTASEESNDTSTKELVTFLDISLLSHDETLTLRRSSDPTMHPDDMNDVILTEKAWQDEPISEPISQPVPKSEINALLVSLFASRVEAIEDFKDVDFFEPKNFIALSDIFEEQAQEKVTNGTYTFNEGNSEVEFAQINSVEYFTMTHAYRSEGIQKSITATAATLTGFGVEFIIYNGIDDIRTIPDFSHVNTLNEIVKAELERLNQEISTDFQPLKEEVIEDTVSDQAQQRIDDDAVLRMETDLFLDEVQSDQDGFDSPNTGA